MQTAPSDPTPAATTPAAPSQTPGRVEPDVPAGADAARDAELKKQAASILEVYSNFTPAPTPDGKKVVFVSDRDGLPQLYVADVAKPDAPPLRLVTTTERVIDPTVTPDGKSVLFRSDKGANENWSIFRVDLDGKNLVELTPGEALQRGGTFVADKATPPVMVYTAQAVDEAKVRVMMQELTPGKSPKLVYTEPSPGALADASRDGTRALLLVTPSSSEAWVAVVDLKAGTTKRLYPPAGKVFNVFDTSFTTDGTRALIATDEGGDRTVLLLLDVVTGEEKARRVEDRPATASVGISLASKRGDFFVERVDAGNHVELRLIDSKTLAVKRDIAVPLGTGPFPRFSDDGKHVAVSWGTPDVPASIYTAEVATGKLTRVGKEARPGLAALPPLDASITEVSSFDGTKIPVNLYLPATLKKAPKPTPVLVMIHGGPAGSASIGWDPFKRFYLAQGYAIVEPNIRGSSGFGRAYEMADNGKKRMDAVKDMEAVARWTMAQPWADKDRLVLWGGSYGGYMVLMGLTRQPEIWRAGVDLFGISDLKSFMASTSGVIRQLFKTEFGDTEKDRDFLESISPLKDVGKIADPLFVYAGANDPRVPRSESDQIVRALRGSKVPIEYMVAAEEGHSLARREVRIEFLARSARFLEKSIGKP